MAQEVCRSGPYSSIQESRWERIVGALYAVRRGAALVRLPQAEVGDRCLIRTKNDSAIMATISGFEGDLFIALPDQSLEDVWPGSPVELLSLQGRGIISGPLLGTVRGYDGCILRQVAGAGEGYKILLDSGIPPAFDRAPICSQFLTGVAAIDVMLPIGIGQRVAISAPPGVGKTTLLSNLARLAQCDVVVIGLIGERGREAVDFIYRSLGDAISRSVVIVATSDEHPWRKAQAAELTFKIAAKLRSEGNHVLLLLDSLTRVSRAFRDLGVINGENVGRGGLTPSVYLKLPALIEMAGNDQSGSMTAFFTSLSEGSEDFDILTQEIRSLTDGHIVLSKDLFYSGWRPAIDTLGSVSRLSGAIASDEHVAIIRALNKLFLRLKDRGALLFGAQADSELQRAILVEEKLKGLFSEQTTDAGQLRDLLSTIRNLLAS